MRELRPQAGPQEAFLSSPADIVIYGGAAGGGKTYALLLEPLRHVKNPGFGGVIFRRTYPEVTNEGGLWDNALEIYMPLGAQPKQNDLSFTFPSGATVSFAHLQHSSDKFKYQGAQICYLAFDELTLFREDQFFYLLSRNRSLSGIRPYTRATCNPVSPEDDPGGWVPKFIAWWIDQETGYAIPERSGIVRWFLKDGDEVRWFGTLEEAERSGLEGIPLSFTFIPATLEDNKILEEADPSYRGRLMALDYLSRERLLRGNWKVVASAGTIFNRAWFDVSPIWEDGGVMCRFVDFAATKKRGGSHDPDFTAAVLQRKVGGTFVIEDVVAQQWSPREVDSKLDAIVEQDKIRAAELKCKYILRWEVEPGSAGIRESQRLVARYAGIDAKGLRPGTGDKWTRARPYAAQCEAGNVGLRRGAWNERWLAHMHAQPEAAHDDIMDASVGSFDALASRVSSLVDFA